MSYPQMHEPSSMSFDQLMARLRLGVTRADMQALALEMFRREMKQRGGLD